MRRSKLGDYKRIVACSECHTGFGVGDNARWWQWTLVIVLLLTPPIGWIILGSLGDGGLLNSLFPIALFSREERLKYKKICPACGVEGTKWLTSAIGCWNREEKRWQLKEIKEIPGADDGER